MCLAIALDKFDIWKAEGISDPAAVPELPADSIHHFGRQRREGFEAGCSMSYSLPCFPLGHRGRWMAASSPETGTLQSGGEALVIGAGNRTPLGVDEAARLPKPCWT